MEVTYKNKEALLLSDVEYLKTKYQKGIVKNIIQFLDIARAAPNLFFVKTMYRGLNIEKLKGKKNVYSARINKAYRIEFTVKNEKLIEIISIELHKIHKHKY